MTQFNNELLDRLLAPGISSFDRVTIPDLSNDFPESEFWVSNLFLNSIFGPQYKQSWRQASITFLFRTQIALRSYNRARALTLECVEKFKPGQPSSRIYFEAVSQWESTLLNMQIASDLFYRVMNPGGSRTDDEQNAWNAANRVKHFAEDVQDGHNGADLTLPMWLASDRLRTRKADVTYEILAEILGDMGRVADMLQRPANIVEARSSSD
jgi:hypothetical protein